MRDHHLHLERGPLNLARLQQFLDQAAAVGVTEIGVTEHLYRFHEARAILWNDHVAARCIQTRDEYVALADAARSAGLPVKFGLEVDYVPGKEDEIARVVGLFPVDYVIGSVHCLGDWCFDLSVNAWQGRSVADAYREYYRTLTQAALSGLFDVIGHPGNIAYYGHRATPELVEELESRFLAAVVTAPVALEANSGGLVRPVGEMFPRPAFLARIVAAGCALTTASDAHEPQHTGHAFAELHAGLRALGVKHLRTFTARRPGWYSIDAAATAAQGD